jgi:Protein of unknown function (DUF4238)
MSQPKHQHFIPRTYLRNFAIEKDGKFFVQAKAKNDEKPKERLLSIKDICVEKNLYTIPHAEEFDKYAIEKYYAENVDAIYPEVYELLTNPKVTTISDEQREKIISTTLSLYFRTPKFLNIGRRRTDKILEHVSRNFADESGNVKLQFMGYNLDFNIDDIEAVKQALNAKEKVLFLKNHIQEWHEFIKFKYRAAISVLRIYEDIKLITSDNPVVMRNHDGKFYSPFDPNNIIHLPLDSKHYLTIYPNAMDVDAPNMIFRGNQDKWFALTTNLGVERNSETWILGEPESLTAHIIDQENYGAVTPENIQSMNDMKEKGHDIQKLNDVITETGTVAHQKVADFVRELLKKRIHENDPEMLKVALIITQLGFPV